ncbi:MAG: MlaD family protein [Myxococcota bacterium]
MNLTKAQKVRLGAFITTGTVLFVGTVTVLAGLEIWAQRDRYTVRFIEDVGGLEVSAPVKYRGLRVGRVEDMVIASDDPTAIEVTLSLDPRTVLYEGTIAEMASSGITGLRTVNLVPGDPKKPKIAPGSQLEAGESFLGRITGRAEQIAVKVEIVANQLAAWTREENRVRMEKLVESITVLAGDLDQFLKTNREPMRDALKGVSRASETVVKLGSEGERSIKTITDEISMTLDEARRTLRDVRRPLADIDPKELAGAVASARRAMTSLDKRLSNQEMGKAIADMVVAISDLTRLLQAADLTIRAGREDFVAALSDLRQAAQDIREFSRIIALDPSAVIRGRD